MDKWDSRVIYKQEAEVRKLALEGMKVFFWFCSHAAIKEPWYNRELCHCYYCFVGTSVGAPSEVPLCLKKGKQKEFSALPYLDLL